MSFGSSSASAPPDEPRYIARRGRRRKQARVSVVVVSHNEGDRLDQTVHNLLETLPLGGEIVVVDDGSTDGSAEAVADRYRWVKVVRPAERLGVAGARNFGARHTQGDVIIFSDAHMQVPPGWAEALVDVLARQHVGAASPAITVMEHPESKAFGYCWRDAALNIEWLGKQANEPYPVPMLPGAFVALRREVLQATGGFDTGMILYGVEDAEFSFRLWTRGYECWLIPEVQVAHLFRDSLPYAVSWEAVLHNLLRVAFVHFGVERTRRVVSCLMPNPAFAGALARLSDSDVWARRSKVRRVRKHDDDWYFERFGMQI